MGRSPDLAPQCIPSQHIVSGLYRYFPVVLTVAGAATVLFDSKNARSSLFTSIYIDRQAPNI